jgi:hypothetical protein
MSATELLTSKGYYVFKDGNTWSVKPSQYGRAVFSTTTEGVFNAWAETAPLAKTLQLTLHSERP